MTDADSGDAVATLGTDDGSRGEAEAGGIVDLFYVSEEAVGNVLFQLCFVVITEVGAVDVTLN